MAPELGHSLIKVDCTSHFSARAMSKLRADCVFSMKYEDYCSPESGEPVFKPEPPHTGVKTFVVQLSPNYRGTYIVIFEKVQYCTFFT